MKFGTAILAVVFILVMVTINFGCRERTINNCEDRGGQVVSYPFYSEGYWRPGCIEPRNK